MLTKNKKNSSFASLKLFDISLFEIVLHINLTILDLDKSIHLKRQKNKKLL